MSAPQVVVGIDASLTKTGIGVVVSDGTAVGKHLTHDRPVEKAKRARYGMTDTPTLSERRDCIVRAANQVVNNALNATLAVVYDPTGRALASGAARQDGPGYWWEIVGALLKNNIPVARVMDTSARKAVTGPRPKGESREAAKVATALAVRKLYPTVDIASDDVADALAAAHLGAVALGWKVRTLARHHDVKWSEWPTLPSATTSGAA